MTDTLRQDSLVLYKNRPARVRGPAADKFELELEGGKTQRVRPKDVIELHPGPCATPSQLDTPDGDLESAWELLAGTRTTLAELAELAFGDYSPAAAWAAWQAIAEGVYFHGSPDEVWVRPRAEAERERATRAAKAAEALRWAALLERVAANRFAPEDEEYLKDVEAMALDRSTHSRLLRELGHQETPESAHLLLLRVGYWDASINPYPRRLRLATAAPDLPIAELPAEERVDLTALTTFAIDDEGNQDPDDALSIDGDRLWVHVADVAARVAAESPADLEARGRIASLYLPEAMVPMLPEAITTSLGLGLQAVSPALSFGLRLGAEGEIAEVEVLRTWVRAQRVTYAEVESRLDEPPFAGLWALAQAFRSRRHASGAAVLEFPEVNIRVRDGEVVIEPLPRLRSRTLVTECMLMAGAGAARFALEHEIPFPFSTQPAPDGPLQVDTPAAMFAARKKLKRRQMKTAPAPHAGLGLEAYAQVTSPLRRYLDLVAHQQLRGHLRGETVLDPTQVLERIGAAEAMLGTLRRAEQYSNKHWTLVYLQRHPNWRGQGVVVDRRGQQATVIIPTLALEAQVQLAGPGRLDDALPLTLTGVDLSTLQAHFRIER